MKKYLVAVLAVVSVYVLYAASNSRLVDAVSAGVEAGNAERVEVLKEQVFQSVNAMDKAAEEDRMDDVIKYATEAKERAKSLEGALHGQKSTPAIVNGEFNPGYALFRADFADEFLVLAKVIRGDITLESALNRYASLTKKDGVFAYLTGKRGHIRVHYMPIAEAFKRWEGCSAQVGKAKEQKLVVKSPEDFCRR